MPNSREAIIEMIDRMANLGWIERHARNVKDDLAVKWTEEGGRRIAEISALATELGIKTVAVADEALWWAVLVLAIQNIPL